MAFATAGIARQIRLAVTLFALASATPVVSGAIDVQLSWISLPWPFTPGAIAYPFAIALVAVACVAVWREFSPTAPIALPRLRAKLLLISISGGLFVATAVIVGFTHVSAPWEARVPLSFEAPFTDSNRAFFEDWLTLKVQFEGQVSTTLGVWIVAGIVGAVIVALSGLSRWATTRRLAALSIGALCIFLLSYGAIVVFLNLGVSGIASNEPVELLLLVARWILVALTLVMVGGKRRSHPSVTSESGVALRLQPARDLP